MELKDFIANSLSQIIDGIKAAQAHAKKNNSEVAPELVSMEVQDIHGLSAYETYTPIHNIKFSVVVTTGDDIKAEGGVGIFVGPITVGAKGSKGESSQATNRIEFEVPIRYPK